MQAFCMQAEGFRLFKISRIFSLFLREETFPDHLPALPSLESKAPLPYLETVLQMRLACVGALNWLKLYYVEEKAKSSNTLLAFSSAKQLKLLDDVLELQYNR